MDVTGTPSGGTAAPAPPAPEGRLSSDGKLMLFGYKESPPQPLAPPKIVDLKPLVMTVQPGKYSWCSCGYSQKQPFCDSSHRLEEHATNRKSYKFEVLEETQIAFCMCRHTGNPPYCDNSITRDSTRFRCPLPRQLQPARQRLPSDPQRHPPAFRLHVLRRR
jgi:CDGSH iron-sulfur domain-containing protein 3